VQVCVFCSSSTAVEPRYDDVAAAVGAALARHGHGLVYGGTPVGTMGTLAHAARAGGARVTGVVPQLFVDRGFADDDADELVVTTRMDERKTAMVARADGFLVLPGGFGTLDELFEVITLGQLGYHDRPIVLIDVPTDDGRTFFTPLLALFEALFAAGFADDTYRELFSVTDDVDAAVQRLATAAPRVPPRPY
jgi:cytokinin riboside 5'-monophosphate phosphoribohydrolase